MHDIAENLQTSSETRGGTKFTELADDPSRAIRKSAIFPGNVRGLCARRGMEMRASLIGLAIAVLPGAVQGQSLSADLRLGMYMQPGGTGRSE